MLTAAYVLLVVFFVGTYVLIWCAIYSWFADHRKFTDQHPRSSTSWNTKHEFFDTVTEFRDDFN